MQRKTKIIATISTLNSSRDFIKGLYRAGMNVVRLNTAHMTHEDALMVVENTRAVSEKIGILLDTKGPEIRTCDAEAPLPVKHGEFIQWGYHICVPQRICQRCAHGQFRSDR